MWKDVSLDPDVPVNERAKLAVWDFPVSDKYGKVIEEIVELIIINVLSNPWLDLEEDAGDWAAQDDGGGAGAGAGEPHTERGIRAHRRRHGCPIPGPDLREISRAVN